MMALDQPREYVHRTEQVESAEQTAEEANRPKRQRRTKAEMEAARAAEAAQAAVQAAQSSAAAVEVPAAVTVTPFTTPPVAPSVAPGQPIAAAPVGVAPAFMEAAPSIAAPSVVTAPPASIAAPQPVVDDGLANYMNMPVEGQFATLNALVVPFFSQPAVRDAVVNTAAQYGLGLPFSDPTDRTIPGPAYRNADPNARYAIYAASLRAVNAAKAAAGL
jgi:hypothetical protein